MFDSCTLPLTSARRVDMLVSEMAVIVFPEGKATLLAAARSGQLQFCEFSLVQMRAPGATWGSLAEDQMECSDIRFRCSFLTP